MPAATNMKKIGGSFSNEEEIVKVIYDFAKDGGAVSVLNLFTASQECIITGFHAVVKTAVTSGGSATVEIGTSVDDDIFVTAKAPAALTANTVLPEDGAFNQALRLAAGATVDMSIKVAALTAGKIEVTLNVQRA